MSTGAGTDNRKVAEAVRSVLWGKHVYMRDCDLYGTPEWWVIPPEVQGQLEGDCEDVVLWCAQEMASMGVPWRDMTPIACLTENGDPTHRFNHLVLGVWDDGKLYIIDNRQKWVLRIEYIKYQKWWFPQGALTEERKINMADPWVRVDIATD